MIYAAVIIIALAIAFVIIIRRLPTVTDGRTFSSSPDHLSKTQPASLRVPTNPSTQPETLMPTEEHQRTTAFSSLPTASLPRRTWKLPKLPTFSLPRWSWRTRVKQAPSSPVSNQPTDKEVKTEFWATEQPVIEPFVKTESAPPVAPPLAPTPIKNAYKDPLREAEDLFAIKDYRRAERLYLKLATTDPKNAKIYSRLGIIYLEQKSYEDAREALQQAIKYEPSVPARHYNLALTYLHLGSKAKAIQAMETTLKYDPSNRKYRKMLDDILADRV